MIKSITLENFQSHEKTTIDFSEGVNAIIGLSDSGKTAILRAIRWVMINKPSGEEFRSYWGGDTIASLKFDNEIKVTRGRSNSDNYYMLDLPGNVKNAHQEFRAFGQDMPDEIKKVIDISDVNMAAQMDAPFLISSNPGEVAQTLNRIVNLDVIDRAVSSVRKEKMEADRMVRQCEETHVDLHVQLEGFNYLEQMESDVVVLEMLTSSKEKKASSLATLKQVISQIKNLDDELHDCYRLLKAEKSVALLYAHQEYVEKKKVDQRALLDMTTTIRRNQQTITQFHKYEKAQKIVDQLLSSVEDAGRLCTTVDTLNNLIWDVRETIKKKDNWVGEYERVKEEFDKIFPDTCPLCGQEVKQ